MLLLRLLDLLNIALAALVAGIFWGPWVALTRSIGAFSPADFVAVVHRLDANLGGLMSVLYPAALLSFVPVLVVEAGDPVSLALGIGALALFVLALVVTMSVEVPIVARIRVWTASDLPEDWQAQRDRWLSFHLLRVIPGLVGLLLLIAGALWQR